MKQFFYKLWAKFLTGFGNIRISKFFPWLYYDTTDFKVTGDKVLEIVEVLKPGDIILRGYDSYLDGKFIDDQLKFSHGAIYIGNNEVIHAIAEGVSKLNILDFCQCDRIAIFRPRRYTKQAIIYAKKYLGYGYDFCFENGNSRLYCFELCALCYPKLDIKLQSIKKFGFLKKHVYLAKSFFDSKDLRCVFHFNPKFNIDHCC